MLTGDNRTTAEAVRPTARNRGGRGRGLPDQKARWSLGSNAKGAWSRWPEMASTGAGPGGRRCRRSPWARARTSAIESAGITLLKGDLTGIVRARRLSQATMSNIRQNLVFAFIYNVAGVPVAAGRSYPLFGVLLSPIIAAAAMALSSVSVVTNALRLNRRPL
ncbi:hypothetical protein ACRAWD_20680 [Caulobacter segnis]